MSRSKVAEGGSRRSRAARCAGRAPGMRRWGAGPGAPTLRSSSCTAIRDHQAPYRRSASCGVPTRTRAVLVGLRPGRVKQRWSVPLDPTERPPVLAATGWRRLPGEDAPPCAARVVRVRVVPALVDGQAGTTGWAGRVPAAAIPVVMGEG